MNKKLCIFIPVLLASCVFPETDAITKYVVKNTVPNTPGGKLFDKEIGAYFTTEILMPVVNDFIFKVLEESKLSERKDVPVLTLYISNFKGYAYRSGDNIYVSGPGLNEYYYPRSSSKRYFTTLMYHEMTHVFQWFAEYTAPSGLIEGIADYVMVKSGLFNTSSYAKPGSGKRWDEGYGVTERFLEYCESLLPSFVAKLNKKMRYKYSESYFVELLGKPVNQLWTEYKFKYGNQPQEEVSLDVFQSLGY